MVLVCFYSRRKKHERVEAREPQSGWAAPPLDNEYFCNAEEGQNKVARWVGYIFPTPLS